MHNRYGIGFTFLIFQTMSLSGMDNKEKVDPLLIAAPVALSLLTYYSTPGKKIKFKVPGTERKLRVPEKVDTVIRYVQPLVQKATVGSVLVGFKQELFDEPYVHEKWDKITSQGAFIVTRVGLDIGLDHSREYIRQSGAGSYVDVGLNSMDQGREAVVSMLPSVVQGPTRSAVDNAAWLSKEGGLMYVAKVISNALKNDPMHALKTTVATVTAGELVGKYGDQTRFAPLTNALRTATRQNALISTAHNSGWQAYGQKNNTWGPVDQGTNIVFGAGVCLAKEGIASIPHVSEFGNKMTHGWSQERKDFVGSLATMFITYNILGLLRHITGKK
jgi:hypothetical protein